MLCPEVVASKKEGQLTRTTSRAKDLVGSPFCEQIAGTLFSFPQKCFHRSSKYENGLCASGPCANGTERAYEIGRGRRSELD